MKLNGSVGRMGRNDKADVALVQSAFAAIKVRGKFGPQPLWKARPDGRNSRELEAAIGLFQQMNNLRPTGKLNPQGSAMSRLRQALPASLRSAQPVRGTTASVSGRADAQRIARKEAAAVRASAAFPDKERATLADALERVGKDLNIGLIRKRDWITQDGRFATELEVAGDLSGTPAERGQISQKIARIHTQTGAWTCNMPGSLKFSSRRQLRALKGTAKVLPARDKALLALSAQPGDPMLAALAQGCARLIRDGALQIERGRAEHGVILDAVANADPALAKKLAAATDGEARLRRELAALEGAAAATALTLDLDSRVRHWYVRQIKKMSDELLAQARAGRIPWETARLQAHRARSDIMQDARDKGTTLGRKLAESLKETNLTIAAVDEKILKREFGGRSFDELAAAERRRFLELAIVSAGKSNERANRVAKIAGPVGRGLWVLTFAAAAYSVYAADDQVQEFARQSAILGSGIVGSMAGGALAGGAVGAATGPGVVIFVAGGVLVGGILGSLTAESAFDELID